MKRDPLFPTEALLCDAFMAWARTQGFTVYPETDGWDLILVDRDGFQIGVEAKLRLNLKVITQALPLYGIGDSGPDHRAVLVPERPFDYERLLQLLGLEVFYAGGVRERWAFMHHERAYQHDRRVLFDWNPKARCRLPEYVPDVRAGLSGPVQLTPWKIGALKVLAVIEARGSITRKQISTLGLDPRAWTGGRGWLVPLDGDEKRNGRYKLGAPCPRFDMQHPDVYARVKADLPAVLAKIPVQAV